MKCPNCGSHIEKGSKFCTTCGFDLEASPNLNKDEKVGKAGKARIVIIVILCILIMALIGLLFYFFPKNTEKSAAVSSTTSKTTQTTTAEIVTIVPETTVNTVDPSISVPIAISDIYASSSLTEGSKTFSPNYMIDGNPRTAWAEGASGIGLGEWVKVEFNGTPTVSGIRISTGYQKTNDSFNKNGRPYVFTANFSNGSSENITITDSMDSQVIMFSSPVETSFVSLDLVGVIPGSAYEDACISEIEFI